MTTEQLTANRSEAEVSSPYVDMGLAYLRRGWSVIPVSADKRPLVKWAEFQKRRPTEQEIRTWAERWPDAGWAIVTGQISGGLIGLDLDPGHSDSTAGKELTPSPSCTTPRGGFHFLYQGDGLSLCSVNPLLPLVELKAEGALIIVPPTPGYDWLITPDQERLAPLPTWLAEAHAAWMEKQRTKAPASTDGDGRIPEGRRKTTAVQTAGRLLRAGFSSEQMAAMLHGVNDHLHDPPWTPAEADREIADIFKGSAKWTRGDQPAKVEVYAARDIEAAEFPEPRWCIPGVIPDGFTLLASRPKRGKSWMALNIGLAVATGGVALGRVEVEEGEVLYLALEDRPRRMQQRLRALLCGDEQFPSRLYVTHALPHLDAGGLDFIAAWLDEHPACRLVILDTWGKARSPRKANADLYDYDVHQGALLHDLAAERQIALLVVHHLKKGESDDPFELVTGSTGITASADTTLVLKRASGRRDADLHITGRDVEETALALGFDAGIWTILGDAEEYRRTEQQAAIIGALKKHGAPMSIAEVATALDWPHTRAKVYLWRMASDGEIKSLGKGCYTLSIESV